MNNKYCDLELKEHEDTIRDALGYNRKNLSNEINWKTLPKENIKSVDMNCPRICNCMYTINENHKVAILLNSSDQCEIVTENLSHFEILNYFYDKLDGDAKFWFTKDDRFKIYVENYKTKLSESIYLNTEITNDVIKYEIIKYLVH